MCEERSLLKPLGKHLHFYQVDLQTRNKRIVYHTNMQYGI